MDPLDVARRFLDAEFPPADAAVVGGSTARGTRTATSDIDLLVIGPAEMFGSGMDSLAGEYELDGEVLEVFAYTPDALEWWGEHDVSDFRPVLHSLSGQGAVVESG